MHGAKVNIRKIFGPRGMKVLGGGVYCVT
jgi:hypothetical protein